MGEVVETAVIERGIVERARRARDEILQAAAKMAPHIAAKLDIDPVKLRAWLDEEMHALAVRVAEAVRGAKRPDGDEHAA